MSEQYEKDHDVLTRIDANLTTFMGNFKEHTEDDKENFDRLYAKTGKLERIVYMALGALAIVEVILRFMKHD